MIEEWRAVVGFEGLYEVSDLGRVRGVPRTLPDGRLWSGRVLVLNTHKRGRDGVPYRSVNLYKGGHKQKQTLLVHRLVLLAFKGPQPHGFEGDHLNGQGLDNRASNLEWKTHKDNCADRPAHAELRCG